MENRFKFRAWDTTEKAMYNCAWLGSSVVSLKKNNENDCYSYHKEYKDLQIMQCTGLADKNDKLIYEGDIVKSTLENKGEIERINGYVFYPKGICGFCFGREWDFAGLGVTHSLSEDVEIIGNIYENPALLNKEEL